VRQNHIEATQPIDAKEFRRVMGLFATGITVVTAAVNGRTHGMTANAVMSVSINPLLVCLSVDARAHMAGFLQEAGGFVLNILTDAQQALSQYFAGQWHGPVPEYQLEPWIGGPRLVGALTSIGCRVHGVLDGGDHRLFLGQVLALYRSEGRLSPLLFFGGRYHRLAEPVVAPRDPVEVWNPEEVQIFYGD
jgi:flavin reductase (DIM6/NTAB) family NADH-FMN oxidoreductase RutF